MARYSKADQGLILIYSILFLFFFELIADFVEAIYAFGLLGTSIPKEIASILFIFSPILLLIFGRRFTTLWMVILGELTLLCRLVEPLLDTRWKMLVSGVGVGCFLIFLPLSLWVLSRKDRSRAAIYLTTGLFFATATSIFLRAWDSGIDISTQGWFQLIGVGLGVLAAALLPISIREANPPAEVQKSERQTSFARLASLCIGITGVLILLYFAFTSPNVISRWTGLSNLSILITIGIGMVIFASLLYFRAGWFAAQNRWFILILNVLFIIALVFTILPHQLQFPIDPAGYPFYEPSLNSPSDLPLYLMLLLSPVILVDFLLYTQGLVDMRPGPRSLGGGFLVCSAFLLVMILAHVFTTVYDYIPLIGPFFRDKFWLVYLVAGILAAFPLLLLPQPASGEKFVFRSSFPLVLAAIYLGALLGFLVTAAKPGPTEFSRDKIRLLTYNIQQGYSADGRKNLDGQLDLIRSYNPDIVGLQESDTNRIAGGNSDVVRYFADRLNMYSYYGPKTVTGTFGIALLSKYPIVNPRTFYMYSEGEQTAAIVAQTNVAGKTFNIIVTHLGNKGPIVQQEALLREATNLENVIAMGDFNFQPGSEQYLLTTGSLQDAWLLKWPSGINDEGYSPADRIDHVFVSPGIAVDDAYYDTSPASDHPALIVDISQ